MSACGGQKRVSSDSLEQELQVIVSCLVWVLGTEFRSSRRAVMLLTAASILPLSVEYSKENELYIKILNEVSSQVIR